MIFLLLCLTSFSMTVSGSLHVATNGIISFSLMFEYSPLYICSASSLFNPLLMDIQAVAMSWLL